ncbi:MAG: nitronate monooxygenase [Deltaproteobacteria bacterium]|nr:nitronate monooxygenase [Deltaproteobacteria bacterium]
MRCNMPSLILGDIKAPVPIVQGGMGVGISLSGLAAAVANQGGIGVISSVGVGMLADTHRAPHKIANQIALREEIRRAKELSNGIIGVNIMVAVNDYDDLLKVSLQENIDVVFMGAGMPLRAPKNLSLDYLKKVKTKFVPIVSSGRACRLIFKTWDKRFNHIPDGVVVEGPLAGGHLGFKAEQIHDKYFSLEKILPQVRTALEPYEEKYGKQIPVIAGGGIYSGSDIHRFLDMGVQGVQMGTRFVATHECDASTEFKQLYVNCRKEDLKIIKSPLGLPGRAIGGKFIREIIQGEKKPVKCSWACLKTCNVKKAPFCIAEALINAKNGIMNKGFAFAGANAYRIKKIITVKELITELIDGYHNSLAASRQFAGG